MNKPKLVVALMLMAGLSACVDGITASSEALDPGLASSDPLAVSFDSLAEGSRAVGDIARADGFTYAALAVRGGLTPAPLDLSVGNRNERFDALVTSHSWDQSVAAAVRPPSHRSLVAWHRGSDNILRVLSLASPSDSAAVIPVGTYQLSGPLSDVYRGVSALYYEINLSDPGSSREKHELATSGWAKVQEVARGGSCNVKTNAKVATDGVTCVAARFVVQLNLSLRSLDQRPAALSNSAIERTAVTVREQSLNGYALKFSCRVVSAQRGCAGG